MYKHGKCGTRIYRIWNSMKNRCLNPKVTAFEHYGGRGIAVCERWHTFENFLADMGDAPPGLTLDRHPNVDGNYEPGNCRWISMKEQNRNRRVHVMLTHDGRTQCLSAWAEELGLAETRLRWHINQGLSLHSAVQRMRELDARPPRIHVQTLPKTNATGFPGVKKSLDKWIARVVVNGKRLHLGTFESAEAAATAYRAHKESSKNLSEA